MPSNDLDLAKSVVAKPHLPSQATPLPSSGTWITPWILLVFAFSMASCRGLQSNASIGAMEPRLTCAGYWLQLSNALHKEAKERLVFYYEKRTSTALYNTHRLGTSSIEAARSVRSCGYYDDLDKQRAIDVIRANFLLIRLAFSNLRDQDQQVVLHLLGEAHYRRIFPHDLR